MKILFIDPSCIIAYNNYSLTQGAIGGTESTVIRVANALTEYNNKVYVTQHLRSQDELDVSGVSYISFVYAKKIVPDIVIILRDYRRLKEFALVYPRAKIFFWMHDLPRLKMRSFRKDFIKLNCLIICVSKFHADATAKILHGTWYDKIYDFIFYRQKKSINIKFIYNLIDGNLQIDDTLVEKNKIIFFSSPNKGLQETILHFNAIKKNFPGLKLYIANPGYIDLFNCKQLNKELLKSDDIVVLGPLKHSDIIKHVRSAFCVFYPQAYKAETFGLIYLEANSVGTPVLAHDFGAAREVLSNSDQLINAKKEANIIGKLKKWYTHGRPKVFRQEKFFKDIIMQNWLAILMDHNK